FAFWVISNTPVSLSRTRTTYSGCTGRFRTSSCRSGFHSSRFRRSPFSWMPRGLVRNFTLLNYSFFVSFFPQLIAGPITHHSEIMPQIGPSQQRDLTADLAVGISIFVVGLFKKVVIADGLAVYADA